MHFKRFVQSSSLFLAGNLLSRAIGFFMIPLYARYLTPAEYGVIELIELTIQIVAMCVGLQSIGGAMIRIYHESTDISWRKRVVSTALLSGAVGNMILIGASTLAAPLLSRTVLRNGLSPSLVVLAFVAIGLANMAEIALVYQRLRDRAGLFVVYSLAYLIVSAALNVYFIAVLHLGVKGFLISKLIASSCGCLYLLTRTIIEIGGLSWSREAATPLVRFGLPLVLSNGSFFVIHFADRFFLSSMTSLTQMGTYALAYRFAFIVSVVVGEPFGRVWSVTLYDYTNNPDWKQQFARVFRYLAFALCLVGLALSVFGGSVVRILASPAFYPAATVIPTLVFAYVAREMGDFFRNVLYINKRSGLVGSIALCGAIINIILNFALIPTFGMYGAAWSTLITWVAYLALCWNGVRREHAFPMPLRSFALAVSLSVGIFAAVKLLPELPPVLHWSAQTFLLVQFIVLAWMMGYFPRQERSFIRSKLQDAYSGLGMWVRQRV